MFEQIVTTGNGVEKRIVAQNQEELDEAVRVAKAEKSATAPDINDPKDGNKIVSPENKHTEEGPSLVDNSVQGAKEEKVETPKTEKPQPKK